MARAGWGRRDGVEEDEGKRWEAEGQFADIGVWGAVGAIGSERKRIRNLGNLDGGLLGLEGKGGLYPSQIFKLINFSFFFFFFPLFRHFGRIERLDLFVSM